MEFKNIKIGPAGLGGVGEAIANLKKYKSLGLSACEIAFTYGVYIKRKEDAIKIGNAAKELGIQLTIHAPYWINLNSKDKEKIEASKQRLLRCCEIGTYLGAKKVIFHPGFYGKKSKEETFEIIKNNLLDLQEKIKEKKYTPKLAPETTGKVNVFGSIDEIERLVTHTKCSFCIDFAHLLARYKSYSFDNILKKFNKYDEWHIHFSGIEHGERGEKRHKLTEETEIKKLLKGLPRDKKITIINESPSPVLDSVLTLKTISRK